jgi:hypothetical protein
MLAAFRAGEAMTGRKKTYIVDGFIATLRSHPALQASPGRKRIVDDLEAVLEALFLSDNERAIEISDEIRGVIEHKHVSMQRRIAMIQRILQAGNIHLSDT